VREAGLLPGLEERAGVAVASLLSRVYPGQWPAAGSPGYKTAVRRLGRGALSGAGFVLAVTVGGVLFGTLPSVRLIIATALAGGFLPTWWEERSRRAQARDLAGVLPQFLDLLVVCQQAGLNLRGSLDRAALAVGGRLGRDVRTLLDTVPPAQLVADLGEKYRVAELRTLGGALRQGELLGIPMVDILRSQAEGLREANRRRAQAGAATAPLKLSVCTVCLFLPAALALVLVPQLIVFLSRW